MGEDDFLDFGSKGIDCCWILPIHRRWGLSESREARSKRRENNRMTISTQIQAQLPSLLPIHSIHPLSYCSITNTARALPWREN